MLDTGSANISGFSITAQVEKMKAAHPNVVLAWLTGMPSGTALHGMHDGGLDVPVLLNAGTSSQNRSKATAASCPRR
jgi:ABC-type branched-subunit amino acid transport system substrate-binding protein